jgi:protein-tyrosine phosphatase
MQRSVLFVCLGNICRSPAAEGVFQSVVRKLALEDQFRIESAGTIGYHAGRGADPRMIQAAQQRGYQLLSRSRQVNYQDLDQFELVIPMDRDNQQDLLLVHASPKSEMKLLSEFLDSSWPTDVPDPYYGGEDGFEYVLDMLEAACPVILDYLREKRSFD